MRMNLPPKRRDTLVRLERAAMRLHKLYEVAGMGDADLVAAEHSDLLHALYRACSAHAAAKAKRGRGK